MNLGQINIIFGWIWILMGMLLGALIGLWSFNGPLPSPLGEYTALRRRMIRLAHIAFIALAVLNILYGIQISQINLNEIIKQIGCLCMIFGAVLMPVLLITAAYIKPVKYFLIIPSTFLIAGVAIMVLGVIKI